MLINNDQSTGKLCFFIGIAGEISSRLGKHSKIVMVASLFLVLVQTGCSVSSSTDFSESSTGGNYSDCVRMTPAELQGVKRDYLQDIEADKAAMTNEDIEVFIRTYASQKEIDDLGQQIRSMAEVRSVEYISKEEALLRLRMSLNGHEDVLDALSGNPLPSSFELYLEDHQRIQEVAARFFDNPIVDNSPGTHDGVKYNENSIPEEIADMQEFVDHAYSCDEARND